MVWTKIQQLDSVTWSCEDEKKNCDFVTVSAGTSQLKISSTQKKCY